MLKEFTVKDIEALENTSAAGFATAAPTTEVIIDVVTQLVGTDLLCVAVSCMEDSGAPQCDGVSCLVASCLTSDNAYSTAVPEDVVAALRRVLSS